MKFAQIYLVEFDETIQCPVSDETAAKLAALSVVVTDEPAPGLPIRSRLTSERHLRFTTKAEWGGTL